MINFEAIKGKYICIEGSDASGKSTLIKNIKDNLSTYIDEILFVREPGGSDLGEQIRDIILHSKKDITPISELLLIFAARADLFYKKIIPAIKNNHTIISDRSYVSSYAYQIYPHQLMINFDELVANCQQNYYFDILIYLNVSVKVAENRIKKDRVGLDRMEKKGSVFFSKVNNGYNEYINILIRKAKLVNNNNIVKIYKTDNNKLIFLANSDIYSENEIFSQITIELNQIKIYQ